MRRTWDCREICRETVWRDNRGMDRYVFYAKESLDPRTLRSARDTASAMGVTVLQSGVGTMLLEAAPEDVRKVARALPQWRYSVERRATRIPERPVAERVRRAAAAPAR